MSLLTVICQTKNTPMQMKPLSSLQHHLLKLNLNLQRRNAPSLGAVELLLLWEDGDSGALVKPSP
jgi:hypothetical protein